MQQSNTVDTGILQLERARLALGEALGQIQDLSDPSAEHTRVVHSIASALQQIYQTQRAGARETYVQQGLQKAIDLLYESLGLVCDGGWGDPTISLVTATLSHSMTDLCSAVGMLDHRRALRHEPAASERSGDGSLDSIPIGALQLVKKRVTRPLRAGRSTIPPAP